MRPKAAGWRFARRRVLCVAALPGAGAAAAAAAAVCSPSPSPSPLALSSQAKPAAWALLYMCLCMCCTFHARLPAAVPMPQALARRARPAGRPHLLLELREPLLRHAHVEGLRGRTGMTETPEQCSAVLRGQLGNAHCKRQLFTMPMAYSQCLRAPPWSQQQDDTYIYIYV